MGWQDTSEKAFLQLKWRWKQNRRGLPAGSGGPLLSDLQVLDLREFLETGEAEYF